MSEPEDFLKRWSRRKREAVEADTPGGVIEPPRRDEVKDAQRATPVQQDDGAVAELGGFDIAKLPSVDSIDADTDISDFLRPGVPPDLTREALRRVWSSDPAIRDYIGPVENGWDFNDPDGILGFGPLKAEEVPRLLARVFEASIGEKPASPQDLPRPQTLRTATAAPDVSGTDVHADAEPSPLDAKIAQGAEPFASDANAAPQREPNDKIGPPF